MNNDVEKLIKLLEKLLTFSDRMSTVNLDISKWKVSRHIEHILLVNTNIFKIVNAGSLDNTNIVPAKLAAYFVLTAKYIPRGRNKTPENLIPSENDDNIIINKLESLIKEMKSTTSQIETSIKKPGKYNHHVFGGLNRKQWLRFMYVHSLHHYKILSDITKN